MENNIKIVKRNGKKVAFNQENVALAISKAFNSYADSNTEATYDTVDINKVFVNAICEIKNSEQQTFNVEEIQDIIENNLKQLGYDGVYEEFSSYRQRRTKARDNLDSRAGKMSRVFESLIKPAEKNSAKRENANIDGNCSMGTMLQIGSIISKEIGKAYDILPEHSEAHETGRIHIHDLDFEAMGTTTCCQIDLDQLFSKGFNTGHGTIRPPQDIRSYSSLAAIAIQSNQNDQHGGQSIPAFDYYLSHGVIKTFRRKFKEVLYDLFDVSGYINVVDFNKFVKLIDDIGGINFDKTPFENLLKNERMKTVFAMAIDKAEKKTERETYQAMEAFIHNLNTMHSRAGAQVPFSSINFGTDTSIEGRMVVKAFLESLERGLGNNETPIFPISVFKVKEGINYNPEDPNYDLFKLACRVSAKRLYPNFSFIDAPFNLQFYKPEDFRTEVAYMGCRTRVMANVANPDKQIVSGRGNLSYTTINLPRIGIKYGAKVNGSLDMDGFYKELDELLELVKNQLLIRYKVQCNKQVKNFPFLMGQGIWMDSKNLRPNDKLKKVLKNGTLGFGFIGLAECLVALIGEHHGESEQAQSLGNEIISYMRNKVDGFAQEYKLNFSLLATPAEGLSERAVKLDKSVFGIIEGITDKEYYTNSFHVPVYHPISISEKIKLEGPYHTLTNGGHITYVELDGAVSENIETFEKIIRTMKENGVGYGAINHPLDRDPVCGFNGVIGDVCPACGRIEIDDVPFERIRRITGYLVGTLDRFNDAKKSEERDRIKHKIDEYISENSSSKEE